jgi:uncharacterized protein YraI
MSLAFPYSGSTTAYLNLREGPGLAFRVKKLLSPGTIVTIQAEQGDWFQVSVQELEGFAHRAYIRSSNGTAPCVGTTSSALNMRAGPDTTYKVLTVLPAGAEVTIFGEQGEWYRVQAKGQEGFVHSGFVILPDQKIPSGFLIDVPELRELSLVPAVPLVASPNNSRAELVARIWNQFGGLLEPLSARLGIDPAVTVAVTAAESGGRGFGPDGRMIIRFENHIFWNEWGKHFPGVFNAHYRFNSARRWQGHLFRTHPHGEWQQSHGKQSNEWAAFELAQSLHDRAAKRSISMGLPQIMGFNHTSIGYDSVEAMFETFSANERNQLLGFFDFIQGPHTVSRRIVALKKRDFVTFALHYNGSGQAARYGSIIQGLFDAFHSLKPAR